MRNYIFDIYPQKALLGGMAEWYRANNPSSSDFIVLEALHPGMVECSSGFSPRCVDAILNVLHYNSDSR